MRAAKQQPPPIVKSLRDGSATRRRDSERERGAPVKLIRSKPATTPATPQGFSNQAGSFGLRATRQHTIHEHERARSRGCCSYCCRSEATRPEERSPFAGASRVWRPAALRSACTSEHGTSEPGTGEYSIGEYGVREPGIGEHGTANGLIGLSALRRPCPKLAGRRFLRQLLTDPESGCPRSETSPPESHHHLLLDRERTPAVAGGNSAMNVSSSPVGLGNNANLVRDALPVRQRLRRGWAAGQGGTRRRAGSGVID